MGPDIKNSSSMNNFFKKLINKRISLLTFVFIPIFFLWDPNFISLMGVQPHWPIFWLFPWACIYGSFYGFLAGLSLGIVLDSLNYDIYSQIPGLVLCGIIFGRFTSYKSDDLNQLKYGLICAVGSFISNSLYFCQIILNNFSDINTILISNGIKIIFAQLFLTGILAPIICKWLFNIFLRDQHNKYSTF